MDGTDLFVTVQFVLVVAIMELVSHQIFVIAMMDGQILYATLQYVLMGANMEHA